MKKKINSCTYHFLKVHTSHQSVILYNLYRILPLYDCTMSFLYSKRCICANSLFQNSQWNMLLKKNILNLLFIFFPFQHSTIYTIFFFIYLCGFFSRVSPSKLHDTKARTIFASFSFVS